MVLLYSTIAITIGVSIMTQPSCFKQINCIIITSNWMAWWHLNDMLLCFVSALGLKDLTLAEYTFIPRHMVFPGNSVTPGSRRPKVWSIDSECKTKNLCI